MLNDCPAIETGLVLKGRGLSHAEYFNNRIVIPNEARPNEVKGARVRDLQLAGCDELKIPRLALISQARLALARGDNSLGSLWRGSSRAPSRQYMSSHPPEKSTDE
jgi:hypothetical protein